MYGNTKASVNLCLLLCLHILCIYILYIYIIYIHTHIYIYIYIYIFLWRQKFHSISCHKPKNNQCLKKRYQYFSSRVKVYFSNTVYNLSTKSIQISTSSLHQGDFWQYHKIHFSCNSKWYLVKYWKGNSSSGIAVAYSHYIHKKCFCFVCFTYLFGSPNIIRTVYSAGKIWDLPVE